MSPKPANKQEEILLRIFVLIKESHFKDHKMIATYCDPVHFPRGLGHDIANFIQGKFPRYYYDERREMEWRAAQDAQSNPPTTWKDITFPNADTTP